MIYAVITAGLQHLIGSHSKFCAARPRVGSTTIFTVLVFTKHCFKNIYWLILYTHQKKTSVNPTGLSSRMVNTENISEDLTIPFWFHPSFGY